MNVIFKIVTVDEVLCPRVEKSEVVVIEGRSQARRYHNIFTTMNESKFNMKRSSLLADSEAATRFTP